MGKLNNAVVFTYSECTISEKLGMLHPSKVSVTTSTSGSPSCWATYEENYDGSKWPSVLEDILDFIDREESIRDVNPQSSYSLEVKLEF